MLHTCDQRFDVTENFENFLELNKAWYYAVTDHSHSVVGKCLRIMCFSTYPVSNLVIDLAPAESWMSSSGNSNNIVLVYSCCNCKAAAPLI